MFFKLEMSSTSLSEKPKLNTPWDDDAIILLAFLTNNF